MNGIIIINKEKGYTSRDIVNIVGKKLNTKKIGHTGTLDPMATGVLVLCVNKATKIVEILQADDKEYIAEITLGVLTDTLDITGIILKEEKVFIEKQDIIDVLTNMKGFYEQEVPIYSAIKVSGKKLYEYARKGIEIDLPKRKVEIKEIELIGDIKYINDRVVFNIRVVVSSGTYIRSLARDIAKKLGTIGVMSMLNRTREGFFKLSDSFTIEDIENNNFAVIELNKNLFNYKTIVATSTLKNNVKNGALIENVYGEYIVLFIDENDELIALYKMYDKNNRLLKPWKMF